jgi:hypothetical protein
MKTEITAFEVAQLAVRLGSETIWKEHVDPNPAIHRAMVILRAAEHALEEEQVHKQQLTELRAGVLFMSKDEWDRRIAEFTGDKHALDHMLAGSIRSELVYKALYKDKKLTSRERKNRFLTLLYFAKDNEMRPPPACNTPEFPVARPIPEGLPENTRLKLEAAREGYNEIMEGLKSSLAAEQLRINTIRWAVEVRERQLAESKSRIIPESLKQKRQQDGDSIQFKRKYSA